MVNKKLVFLGLLGSSCLLLAFAVAIPGVGVITSIIKLLLLLIAIVMDLVAFMSRQYSYIILPLLGQRNRNVVLSTEEPYRLSSSSDSILQQNGETFTATVYINIPLYSSSTEMSDAREARLHKAGQQACRASAKIPQGSPPSSTS